MEQLKPSMTTGFLECSYCGLMGRLTWVDDGQGGCRAQLPPGFHVETRSGLGRVVVCDQCDQIMPPPGAN
jgi:hypothetical protein